MACHSLVSRSVFVGILLSTACSTESGAGDPKADLALLNGAVITLDANDRVAEAVAARQGMVVAVGSDREVERLIGPETQRVDLKGRTVTPGLMDAHAHFSSSGADRLYVVDLGYPNVHSVRDVVAKVKEQVAHSDSGEWVHGRGWDEGKLEELRYVYATDLDSVAPHNPVWLSHTMGHYGVANSLALRLANITHSCPSTFDPVL